MARRVVKVLGCAALLLCVAAAGGLTWLSRATRGGNDRHLELIAGGRRVGLWMHEGGVDALVFPAWPDRAAVRWSGSAATYGTLFVESSSHWYDWEWEAAGLRRGAGTVRYFLAPDGRPLYYDADGARGPLTRIGGPVSFWDVGTARWSHLIGAILLPPAGWVALRVRRTIRRRRDASAHGFPVGPRDVSS